MGDLKIRERFCSVVVQWYWEIVEEEMAGCRQGKKVAAVSMMAHTGRLALVVGDLRSCLGSGWPSFEVPAKLAAACSSWHSSAVVAAAAGTAEAAAAVEVAVAEARGWVGLTVHLKVHSWRAQWGMVNRGCREEEGELLRKLESWHLVAQRSSSQENTSGDPYIGCFARKAKASGEPS